MEIIPFMPDIKQIAHEWKVVAELSLAAGTVIVTVLIATTQILLQINQQEVNKIQSEKSEFIESVKFLREDRDKDCKFFLDSADIARSVAQKMRDRSVDYSEWVQNIVQANAKCALTKSVYNDEFVELQSKEAAERAQVENTNDRWFAVAGSFSVGNGSLDRAKVWAKILRQRTGLCTEVWKTKASKSYAVVMGSVSSQAKALENSAIARSLGGVSDAFTQIDRDWTQIITCENR